VKGPVMDRLQKAGFVEKVGAERFFLSTHQAMQALGSQQSLSQLEIAGAPHCTRRVSAGRNAEVTIEP
jgi:hypothetical protein